jgi:hypothetical protein
MKIVPSSMVLAALLVGGSALAAEPSAIEVGARTGYSLAFNESSITGRLPFILDAGYRFNPDMYVGALVQYGVLFFSGASGCQANVAWIGFGFGYTWLSIALKPSSMGDVNAS